MKIAASGPTVRNDGASDELAILERISDTNAQNPGSAFVRKLLDSFTVRGPNAEHQCTVFEALREPLWLYRRRFVGNVIPPNVLKILLQMILEGLDYLHSECHVIHTGIEHHMNSDRSRTSDNDTDLKTDNIMIRFEDPAIPQEVARDEYEYPLPQKHLDDGRIIYLSRNGFGALRKPTGIICITDFDRAVFGTKAHSGCISADNYRAPEVILDCGYSYPTDIWNLGVMVMMSQSLLRSHTLTVCP